MTGERKTRRKHWSWLVLVWLGAFLMLGALSLPVQAASRLVAPAAQNAPGLSFLTPRSFSLSAEAIGVYDTPLGQWVQQKDFARKDFGTPGPSRGSPLTPIPPSARGAPPPPAASEASPDDLEARPIGPVYFPTLDRFVEHIAMRGEDRRRLVGPENIQPPRWRANAASGDALPVPSPDPGWVLSPAFRREILTAAQWCKRTFAADSPSQDAADDPTDDPPPVTHPLLISPLTFDTYLSLHASFPLVPVPNPIVCLRTVADVTSQTPRHLLAWPALRIRPPPGFAPSASVLPLGIITLS